MPNINYQDILKESIWITTTIYYEARGETPEGQKAVVKVILNRSNKNKQTAKDTVLKPKQFSCYNSGYPSIEEVKTFLSLNPTVMEAIDEWFKGDTLGGATHYYAIKAMVGNKPPYWASSMKYIADIGGHRFLKEI